MATNWPQQVNPRACRSALCVCTADWNSKRENNCRSCENILLTRVKADPPSLKSVAKPDDNLSEAQPFFGISFQIVIWTRVVEVTVFTDSLSVHSYTSVKVLSFCYG